MGEPAPSPELFGFPNVILTPHIGSATVEAREAMSLAVVDNLRGDDRRSRGRRGSSTPRSTARKRATRPDRLGSRR